MSIENEMAQSQYLAMGGPLQMALARKIKSGEIQKDYVYREYPKMLRISKGMQTFDRTTDTCKNRVLEWSETIEVFDEIIVQSEEEEERVLSGGKTSSQLEADRQGLVVRARSQGIKVDPSWSAVRLRRELGDKLDAPAPVDELDALQEKVARLRQIADMRAEIAALEAQLGGSGKASGESVEPYSADIDEVRTQLSALGVTIDKRWGANRLREELDRATEPRAA